MKKNKKKIHTQQRTRTDQLWNVCIRCLFECEILLGVFIKMICLTIFKWFSQWMTSFVCGSAAFLFKRLLHHICMVCVIVLLIFWLLWYWITALIILFAQWPKFKRVNLIKINFTSKKLKLDKEIQKYQLNERVYVVLLAIEFELIQSFNKC